MIRIKVLRKNAMKFPGLKLNATDLQKAGKVVEGSILDNIRRQQQTDGSTLKENAYSTRERKRKAGRPTLSLVDKLHRFVQGNGASWKSTVAESRNAVVVTPATAELAELSRNLQRRGYTGWFGLNASGVEAIKAIIRNAIRRAFARSKRGGGA